MLYQRMHVKCAKEMVKMQKSIQMPQILQKGCVLQRGNICRTLDIGNSIFDCPAHTKTSPT